MLGGVQVPHDICLVFHFSVHGAKVAVVPIQRILVEEVEEIGGRIYYVFDVWANAITVKDALRRVDALRESSVVVVAVVRVPCLA